MLPDSSHLSSRDTTPTNNPGLQAADESFVSSEPTAGLPSRDMRWALSKYAAIEEKACRYVGGGQKEATALLVHFLPAGPDLAGLAPWAYVADPNKTFGGCSSLLPPQPHFVDKTLGYIDYRGGTFLESYGRRFGAAQGICRESYDSEVAALQEAEDTHVRIAAQLRSHLAHASTGAHRKDLAKQIVSEHPNFQPALMEKITKLESASFVRRLTTAKARATAWHDATTALNQQLEAHLTEAAKAQRQRTLLSQDLTAPMAKRHLGRQATEMVNEHCGDLTKLCVLAHQVKAVRALELGQKELRHWVIDAASSLAMIQNPHEAGAAIKETVSQQTHEVMRIRAEIKEVQKQRDTARSLSSPKTPEDVESFLQSSALTQEHLKRLEHQANNALCTVLHEGVPQAKHQCATLAGLFAAEQCNGIVSVTAELATYVEEILTSYEATKAQLPGESLEHLEFFTERIEAEIVNLLPQLFHNPRCVDYDLKNAFLAAGGSVLELSVKFVIDGRKVWKNDVAVAEFSIPTVSKKVAELAFLPKYIRESFVCAGTAERECDFNRYKAGWRTSEEWVVKPDFKQWSVWLPYPETTDSLLAESLVELVERRARASIPAAVVIRQSLPKTQPSLEVGMRASITPPRSNI